MKKIHAILLAAGNSRRFDGNKLLYPYRGKPMYRHILERISEAAVSESEGCKMGIRVLISQYEEILKDGSEEGYLCLKNTKPEQGISRSIRMGIEAVEESESYEPGDGILFSVCDQPKLTLETLKRLMESFASSGKGICAVAAAGDEAKMGNPVIFSDRYWGELKCLMKDQGGKVVVKKHLEDTVSVPAGDEAELQDIDYRADLKPFVIVRGGGDLATGTAHRLHREGCRVLILETKRPACIRRQVSFCEAVYEGSMEVEGVTAVRMDGSWDLAHQGLEHTEELKKEVEKVWAEGKIPVLVDPAGRSIENLHPDVLVDAILAKKNLGTTKEMAPLTIGLGPGFTAGQDVDVVIETMRGSTLGKIYREGSAIPNTGVPGMVAGYSKERVIHAPGSGTFQPEKAIGDLVAKGDVLGFLMPDHIPVTASMPGLLRGMIREGYPVTKGLKIMDIEPRIGERDLCFQISDKAKKIGDSVYQVIREYEDSKTEGQCSCVN